MACKYVYKDYISCGVETLYLELGATPGLEYNIVIDTPQGAKYMYAGTVNVEGNVPIPLSSFPAGLFNPYAGAFSLSIESDCDPFLFCDYYAYIQFEVVNGNQGKNTLSCCAPPADCITGGDCCTTTTEVFTDEAITVVSYTGSQPSIEVLYLNENGTYTISGIMTLITVDEDTKEFTIDHGGVASGKINLTKCGSSSSSNIRIVD